MSRRIRRVSGAHMPRSLTIEYREFDEGEWHTDVCYEGSPVYTALVEERAAQHRTETCTYRIKKGATPK